MSSNSGNRIQFLSRGDGASLTSLVSFLGRLHNQLLKCKKTREMGLRVQEDSQVDIVGGLHQGFGILILYYIPSYICLWASYSVVQKVVWSGVECIFYKIEKKKVENDGIGAES